MDLLQRPRRLRATKSIRELFKEHYLHPNDFMLPLFIKDGTNIRNPIASMPGHFQISVDNLNRELDEIAALGIRSVMLFGIPKAKDECGSGSLAGDGIVQQAIMHIKSQLPDIIVAADVCLCEYTSHGHCGVVENLDVDNDKTIHILAKQALSFAQHGADIVAPSAMMDGMVLAIRRSLDSCGYKNTPIMSYAVKYASSMYGPFREAAEGAPKFGDRKTYQMDYANSAEAVKEAKIDVEQGADILMVKPAASYLDVILRIKQTFPEVPLAAYHTSGEYAMLKAASQNGWIDEQAAMLEVTTAIKRAGANLIITYYAKDLVRRLAL